MLRTMFVTGSITVLFAAAAAAQDQGLAPETLEAMKNSTVMVKQKLGPVGGSGSGFVVQVDGDTCLIITNEHVIHRLDVAKYEAEIADLLRQYPAGPEHGRLVALRDGMRGAKLESTVVFRSNRPDEQEIAYELLAADEDADLAVLKVKGIKQPPKPIDYRHGEKFIETTAVLIVGFPLGEKLSLLSMGQGTLILVETIPRQARAPPSAAYRHDGHGSVMEFLTR